jgi:hypothetical protein
MGHQNWTTACGHMMPRDRADLQSQGGCVNYLKRDYDNELKKSGRAEHEALMKGLQRITIPVEEISVKGNRATVKALGMVMTKERGRWYVDMERSEAFGDKPSKAKSKRRPGSPKTR